MCLNIAYDAFLLESLSRMTATNSIDEGRCGCKITNAAEQGLELVYVS